MQCPVCIHHICLPEAANGWYLYMVSYVFPRLMGLTVHQEKPGTFYEGNTTGPPPKETANNILGPSEVGKSHHVSENWITRESMINIFMLFKRWYVCYFLRSCMLDDLRWLQQILGYVMCLMTLDDWCGDFSCFVWCNKITCLLTLDYLFDGLKG